VELFLVLPVVGYFTGVLLSNVVLINLECIGWDAFYIAFVVLGQSNLVRGNPTFLGVVVKGLKAKEIQFVVAGLGKVYVEFFEFLVHVKCVEFFDLAVDDYFPGCFPSVIFLTFKDFGFNLGDVTPAT